MIVSVPAFFRPDPQAILSVVVPPASVPFYGALYLLAWAVGPGNLDRSNVTSPVYLASHVLKIPGGGAGGYWIAANARWPPSPLRQPSSTQIPLTAT